MSSTMWVTIGSVLIGFLFFGASFASFSMNKPRKLVWTLFAIAIVFMTIVPTTTAIFIATKG
ncbi:hypothetical protein [Corynebacterium auriscanis]|uniref:hypothetical protein n=1 Tax=Corynebacterium auriscanis TaxID=99807 RepID=UPI0022468C56|nr:hypothetical protein [Corynebacterium auriscanis]MCX2163672.1 hypothetical protein [Corynebacterium auriscanis]